MKSAVQNAHGSSPTMPKTQIIPASLHWLIPLIVVLALIAAGTGLFSQDREGPYTFQTLRGQQVEMYGRGIYARDSLLAGAGFRGADAGFCGGRRSRPPQNPFLIPPLLWPQGQGERGDKRG